MDKLPPLIRIFESSLSESPPELFRPADVKLGRPILLLPRAGLVVDEGSREIRVVTLLCVTGGDFTRGSLNEEGEVEPLSPLVRAGAGTEVGRSRGGGGGIERSCEGLATVGDPILLAPNEERFNPFGPVESLS